MVVSSDLLKGGGKMIFGVLIGLIDYRKLILTVFSPFLIDLIDMKFGISCSIL
jgi:hypothetical protein